jgi:hypothetical protein
MAIDSPTLADGTRDSSASRTLVGSPSVMLDGIPLVATDSAALGNCCQQQIYHICFQARLRIRVSGASFSEDEMTALKHLAILVALLAGGILVAMMRDFASDNDA